uniref:Filamentous hemagglutinin-like protein n=1 Tax=Chlorobium chlorochromatii (strain CaD3) TaxID=340177 RepID=Q3ARR0_CHLCH
MNRVFNVIWSITREKWVVVSERVKSNGSVPKSSLVSIAFLSALLGGGSVAQAVDANQLPTGGVIAAGSGSIAASGNSMTIQQSSQKMVANWSSFNVGSDASVRFQQPNASAAALNRIAGQSPSQILGSLSANGRVFLVNPSGIVFGKNARVDVGGLVASTLNISDNDFLAGNYAFRSTGSAGTLRNEGVINAMPNGVVALLSPSVVNNGTINAAGGTVALAAGNAMTLDFGGDGLMTVRVDEGAVNALVENNALIKADGGLVVMSAKAADELALSAVNSSGVVQAMSVVEKNGRILLDAEGGQSTISGTLDASSVDGKGGQVVVTGKQVMVADGAHLNASGLTGGGEVLVGGSWQGSDASVRQAVGTVVMPGALLQANATGNGNGGTVVVWSDVNNPLSVTRAYGTFEAYGGLLGGNGGRIETSGHWLDVAGSRGGASAVNGNAGVWLFDPWNVIIGPDPTTSGTSFTNPFNPTGDSTILASNINTLLNAGTSVSITTGTGGTVGVGDISVNAPILKTTVTGLNTLTLSLIAEGNIFINNSIGNSSGTLNLNLTTVNGAISGTGNITGNGNGDTIFTVGAGSGTYSGNLVDRRFVEKKGVGTLIVSGDNNHDGETRISAGTLVVQSSTALGKTTNGTQVVDGATLQLEANIAAQELLYLAGDGVNSNGALKNIGGNHVYGGDIILLNNSRIMSDANTLTLNGSVNGAYSLTVNSVGSTIFNGLIGNSAPLGAFIGTAGTPITFNGSSITTVGAINAAGVVTASNPLTISAGAGNISLSNTGNNFNSVNITSAGTVSLVDTNALALTGVNATGDVSIATRSGDLTIDGHLLTTSPTSSAMILNAEQAQIAGNGNGGNLVFSSGTLTVGSGGIATLYTGSVAGSTSIASVVNAGHFRYNSDEAINGTHYTDPLTAGLNLIYREQPTLLVAPAATPTPYGTAPSYTPSYSGAVNNDPTVGTVAGTPQWAFDNATIPTKSLSGQDEVGTYNVKYVGGLTSTLGYGFADNGGNGELTIAPKEIVFGNGLTGGVNNKVYDGTLTGTITPLVLYVVAGDNVSLNSTGATATFSNKNVGVGKTVTVAGLALTGDDAGNYSIGNQTTTANIIQASLTVTAPGNLTKVYDGTVTAIGVATVTGLVSGDTVAGTVAIAYADKMAGSSKAVNPLSVMIVDGSDMNMTGNYNIAYVPTVNNTITQASLTLTSPDNVSKFYDGLMSAPGAPMVTGLVPNDVVVTPAPLSYNDPEVGNNKTVSPNPAGLVIHDANGGDMTPNYVITTIPRNDGVIVEKTFTPYKEWNDIDPSTPEVPTAAPEVSGNRDLGDVELAADDGGTTATRSLAMVAMDETAIQSDIVVTLLEPAAKNKQGVVKVFVPKEVLAKPAFLFPLPDDVATAINQTAVQERVFLQNGDALPGWLSYDRDKKIFTAKSAPAGSLPLTVMVQAGSMAWQVIIQQ